MTDLNNTQQPKKFKVLLIGDSCTDQYFFGSVLRISPEAPVPILKINRQNNKPGMAANVYENLLALECNVDFITNQQEITKTRFIDERTGQHLLRVDNESTLPTLDIPTNLDYNAIIISDYNKGSVSYELIESLRENYSGPIFIDTKKQDLKRLRGCVVKINESEFNACHSLCDDLIVTLGSKGAKYKDKIYKSVPVDVFDVCGAGDTFLAALTYEYMNSGDMETAIVFANEAASITVQHVGVYAPSLEEIKNEIRSRKS